MPEPSLPIDRRTLEVPAPNTVVSVGICAHNEEPRIGLLLDSLVSQAVPASFELREILVVASGCTDKTEQVIEERARQDPRIRMLREAERSGKASALNLILQEYGGDILVLLNADAFLPARALAPLLDSFREDPQILIACGAPLPNGEAEGIGRGVYEFLWRIHNRTLQTLSALNVANHCCDEFLAMRRGFVGSLPRQLVNDGAYLGVLASVRGHPVKFRRDAAVIVNTPWNLSALVMQRRRILRGHQQIRDFLGVPPSTLEGLVRGRPDLVVRILVSELRNHPWGLLHLLLVIVPLESIASLLAFADRVRGRAYDPVWSRVGRPS